MNPQSSYRVFIAMPFDGSMVPMYEKIIKQIRRNFGERFEFVIGNDEPIKSKRPLTIELFKNQNIDLLEQFYFNIRSSDIIISDLTNNNPNVHVELGIALTLSKNILRVSGRDLRELASDVSAYETRRYRSEEELRNQIEKYLRIFLSIKELPINKKAGHFYKIQFRKERGIEHGEILHVGSMRDGALRAKFKFIRASEQDWFGVFVRSSQPNPWLGGYLLYIRKNGSMELAKLPVNILKVKKYSTLRHGEEHTIQFGVDGDNLVAYLDGDLSRSLKVEGLDHQTPGNVSISCHAQNGELVFREVETVIRDTMNFDFSRPLSS